MLEALIGALRALPALVALVREVWLEIRPLVRARVEELQQKALLEREAEEVGRGTGAIDGDTDGTGAARAIFGDDGLLLDGGNEAGDASAGLGGDAEARTQIGLPPDV